MKGTVSTVGLTARAFRVNQEDSPYIICMKKTGAIPFIKTNLPQNAMNFDS
jgi:Asp-tRNA(Asn)/Glu-tRNA(Gln) amidotransferase A subunit family amidase